MKWDQLAGVTNSVQVNILFEFVKTKVKKAVGLRKVYQHLLVIL